MSTHLYRAVATEHVDDPPEVVAAELRAENRELRDRIRALTG